MKPICRIQILFVLLSLVFVTHASSEPEVIISEATYTMGDGETPAFAEEMVLRKAKQLALEQAGTYVESYTKVRNLDLTVEEIQTIAGGILGVEVLDQRRTMVGDSLQFFVKIKAIATTDKMDELAKRVKGRDVVAEYKKLQGDYARLSEELETWKQTAGKSPGQAERTTAHEQILQHQKALAALWVSQDGLVRSLVSGQDMVVAADNEKETLDELVRTMSTKGHTIELGKGNVVRTDSEYRLIVPVTLKLKEEAFHAITDVARRLHGTVWPKLEVVTSNPVRVRNRAETSSPISIMAARVSEELLAAASFQRAIDRLNLLLELRDGIRETAYCLPGFASLGLDAFSKRWPEIRRLQPVSLLRAKTGEGREDIHAYNGLSLPSSDFEEFGAVILMQQGYRMRARGPDGKIPPGYRGPDVTVEKGYVALIRHEANFRVAISLSADFARSLKQITAAIITGDPLSLPPEADTLECTILPEE